MKTKLRISFGSRRSLGFAGRSPLALLGVLVALFGALSLLPPTAAATASDWSLAEAVAPSEHLRSPAAPNQGTLTVTILNEDPNQSNHVIAFYDHNASVTNIPYMSGHYIGARICASGGTVTGITADLLESVGTPNVAFPAYDGDNDENEFELGRNESVAHDLGDLDDGECALAYYFIFTPRFKNGGTEIPQIPADGITQTFAIEVTGMAGGSPVSANDSSIVEIDQAISAMANKINVITAIQSGVFLTVTVDFHLGQPGGTGEATFNPTGWVSHEAGIFDLVGVSINISEMSIAATDVLFINGVLPVGGQKPRGMITYTFKVVGSGTTEFFPAEIVSSGTQDKYNGDVGESTGIVSAGPNLEIAKECTPYYVEVGGKVTCTITYSNTGDVAAESVRLKDDYDEDNGGVSNISDGGVDDDDVISWTIGTVAIDARDTVSYVYTVDTGAPVGTIHNGVTAYSDGQDPLTDVDEWEVVSPTISIVKKANGDDPEYILYNDTVVYNYYVTNGPASTPLTDVIVTDDKCTLVTEFDVDDLLNPSETWEFRCTKNVTETTINTGTVTAQPADISGEPLPGVGRVDDDDTATVNVVTPTIQVVKTADPTKIHSGESVLYTYKLTNQGNVALDNVSLTDDHDPPCGSPTLAEKLYGDTDDELEVGEEWRYTCSAAVTADITNTAKAEGHGVPLPSDPRYWTTDYATATVDVIHPAIEVVKTADPISISSGDWVTYTYRVENTGDDTLTNVEISDDKCDSPTIKDGDPDTNPDVFNVGDVLTYTCSMTLTSSTSNLATVTGTDSLGDPVVDTSSPPVEVKVVIPGFEVNKEASAYAVHVDDWVTYTYWVSNTSDTTVLTDVVVLDNHCSPGDKRGDDVNPDVLDPLETWIYTCTIQLGEVYKPEKTNTFSVTATVSETGETVSDQDQSTVQVFDPAITVIKSVDRAIVQSGDTVTYTYEVENTGNVSLTVNSWDISDDECGTPGRIGGTGTVLDPGVKWTYECAMSVMDDITNTVTVTGTDSLGKKVNGSNKETVDVVTPTVEIAKTANPTVTTGGSVVYDYAVTNPGDTLLQLTKIDDDKCTDMSSLISGDDNSNGLLDPGETWRYNCTVNVGGDVTNTVTVTAQPSIGLNDPLPGFDPVTDTVTATVDVVAPDIDVLKTADPTKIHVGESVTYTYRVTNTGDTVLTDIQVDDRVGTTIVCSPDKPASKENDNGDDLFDPDEIWTYTCTQTLVVPTDNEVTVSGQPSDESGNSWGHIARVDGTYTATVEVIDPKVSIGKTPSADKIDPGDTVTYTYRVENTGDDPLTLTADDVTDSACAPVTGPEDDNFTIGLLDPGEEWVFTCTTQLNVDTTNYVTVTVTDTLGIPISATNDAFVDVVIAGVELEKMANEYTIHAGDTVTYTFTVSNTAEEATDVLTDVVVTDDHCTPEFVSGDTDVDNELDKGELWVYQCVTDTLDVTTKNKALATAIVSDTGKTVSDTATVEVVVLHPAITVTKSADKTVIRSGMVVEYTYLVSNPGDTPLSSVTVGDPHCNPGSRISGDNNPANGLLDPDEEWLYRCSKSIQDDITNTVTASGHDSLGPPYVYVTAEASEFVDVVTPTIEIIKSADPILIPPEGGTVQYTYVVNNTGDTALEVIRVNDRVDGEIVCSPDEPVSKENGDDDDLLEPGESWTYECSIWVTEATTNTATASGQPWNPESAAPIGTRITDEDTASVEVGEEQVSPVGGATMPNNPLWSVFLRVGLAALVGLSLTGGAVVVRRKRGRK